ncbi:unnamed protein product [Ilex paraguariensis]
MASNSPTTIPLLLIMACLLAVLVPSGLARQPRRECRDHLRIAPNLSVPPQSSEKFLAQQCWATIWNLGACVADVYRYFLSGRMGTVSPTCCKAFTGINVKCWPIVFPFNPFFTPPSLRSFCAVNEGAALTPSQPL